MSVDAIGRPLCLQTREQIVNMFDISDTASLLKAVFGIFPEAIRPVLSPGIFSEAIRPVLPPGIFSEDIKPVLPPGIFPEDIKPVLPPEIFVRPFYNFGLGIREQIVNILGITGTTSLLKAVFGFFVLKAVFGFFQKI
jgi:hypothetical protein